MNNSSSSGTGHKVEARKGEGGELTILLSGRIVIDSLMDVMPEMRSAVEEVKPSRLIIDLSGVEHMDSAGALAVLEAQKAARAGSIPSEVRGMSGRTSGILKLLSMEALEKEPIIKDRTTGILEYMGQTAIGFCATLNDLVLFVGELVLALLYAARHPRSVRWGTLIEYMKRAGLDGLPIIGLISFLFGIIIALLALSQLKEYGGNVVLPAAISFAMVKEFGPIMTAILVAGRTGSEYAAEIATMKINEEVDALVIMGFNPVSFLAVPKVLAALLMVPLLALYADLFGVLGGMVIGVLQAGLTITNYVVGVPSKLSAMDLVQSVVKSGMFGVLIAGIGCYRGFMASGGAEEVGTATTSAVVSAIFLVILSNALFAVVVSGVGV
ncbi:MAG: ABC transporter permease [Nitrospirota bacterium]|jgi:phospholipid/cholesterol/gamma-HCH transport system permease protein